MRKSRLFASAAAGVCMVACGAVSAMAQEVKASAPEGNLQEIIVTALKVKTNLQNTPVSVATVGGEALAATSVSDIRDAMKNVPGLIFNSQGNFGMQVSARGVGPGVLSGQGGMSTLYDGIYSSSDIAWRVGYYDVSRIETLLGPQGTLYGRNAEGGVINLVTNDPTANYEGKLSAGVGNYAQRSLQGMVNVPLTDNLYLRVAGSYSKHDGYLSNGQNDNGTAGLRAKLLYKPVKGLSILLGAEDYIVDEKGQAPVAPFTTANTSVYTVPYTPNQSYRRNAYRLWGQVQADLGIGDLTLIPAYTKTRAANELTYDPIGLNSGYSQISAGLGSKKEKSFEARLNSHATSPIQWIFGAYFYNSNDTTPGDTYSGSSLISLQNNTIVLNNGATSSTIIRTQDSQGFFGQVTVPIIGQLKAMAGLRYSKDKATYFNDGKAAGSAGSSNGSWSHTDYHFGLQYNFDARSMVYVSTASGYRPGGFNPAPPYPSYNIETIKSYELGTKNEFFGRKLRVNADVFYYNYAGYQQITFSPCSPIGAPPTPGLPVCTGPIPINLVVQNVDKVDVYGGELSVQYAPTRNDHLSGSVTFNSSQFKSPLFVNNPTPFNQLNVQGTSLPMVPKLSGNIHYGHDFAAFGGKLSPEFGATYQSRVILSLPSSAFNDQQAYWLVDASIGFAPAGEKWKLNIWGRNLGNEVVKASGNGTSVYLAAPRTYGLTFSANF